MFYNNVKVAAQTASVDKWHSSLFPNAIRIEIVEHLDKEQDINCLICVSRQEVEIFGIR